MSDPFWDWIDQNLVTDGSAVCYAVDGQGMRAVYTSRPVYHTASNRWTPTGDGRRVNLGLVGIRPGFDGSKTLVIRPGCEDQLGPEPQPSDRQNMLAPNTIRPDQKGPDAQGTPVEPQTSDDLAQANLRAMGLGRQADEPLKPSASQERTQNQLQQAEAQEKLEQVLALVPKTKAEKNQQLLEDARAAARRGLTTRDVPTLERVIDLVAETKQRKVTLQIDRLLELAGL